MNTLTQPVNPPEIPVQPQPIQSPPINNQKSFLLILLGGIVLLLVVGGGAYYLGTQQNKSTNQAIQQPTPITTTIPTTAVTQSSPTEISAVNPLANLTWKTQNIDIQEDTERTGKITINMELKLPSDWIFQITPVAANPNNLIKNCSTYSVTSKDQAIKLLLHDPYPLN